MPENNNNSTVLLSPLECLYHWEKEMPNTVSMVQPVNGDFQQYDWSTVGSMVRKVAYRLREMEFEAGSRVAILSKNCVEWIIADLAIMMAGCVSVPIFATAGRQTIEYVLKHADVKLLFVGKLDNTQEAINGVPDQMPTVAFPYPGYPAQTQWAEFLNCAQFKACPVPEGHSLMTIIYTSGSTGHPKGVMHSYEAMSWAGRQGKLDLNLSREDRLLSYLPLAHITERVLIEMAALQSGMSLHFVESLETFRRDVQECQPTLFVSVPRLWSKFQLGILHKLSQRKLNLLLKIPVISSLIKRKVRSGLGLSHTKLCASGSAPLAPPITAWFAKLGIEICEGWGMTENAALGTACLPFKLSKIGCIGVPWGGVSVKLSQEQELLVKAPGNMLGYYLDDERTREAFTENGYLRTGDKAKVDSDGYFSIIGRVKDIFKTSKGKYVTPAPIEAALMENTLIEQVCVTGIGLPHPVGLLVLAEDAQSIDSKEVAGSLEVTLNKVNATLESHQRLDHLVVMTQPWTIENGLLTPTLKVKRHMLEERFPTVINNSYTQPVVWVNN